MAGRRVIVIDLTNDEPIPRINAQVIDLVGSDTEPNSRALRSISRDTLSERDRILSNIQNRARPRRRRRISNEEDKENQRPAPSAPPVPSTQGLGVTATDTTAYCVKCRKKQSLIEGKEVTTSNGRKALQGKCSVCGTKMMKFIKK